MDGIIMNGSNYHEWIELSRMNSIIMNEWNYHEWMELS